MKKAPGWVKGCCLASALVAVSLILFTTCVATNQLGGLAESQTRAKVARVSSDSRTLYTAIEQYNKDNGSYPPSGSQSRLTSPVAYLNSPMPDAFATAGADKGKKLPLSYYITAHHLLIWSVGPDGKSDLNPIADPHAGQNAILLKSYDATNGTVSAGDIIRINRRRSQNRPR